MCKSRLSLFCSLLLMQDVGAQTVLRTKKSKNYEMKYIKNIIL